MEEIQKNDDFILPSEEQKQQEEEEQKPLDTIEKLENVVEVEEKEEIKTQLQQEEQVEEKEEIKTQQQQVEEEQKDEEPKKRKIEENFNLESFIEEQELKEGEESVFRSLNELVSDYEFKPIHSVFYKKRKVLGLVLEKKD
jgi:outer membrane biosynthesis protein TonB